MANAIFQGTDENILRSAVWSGTAPASTYALTTFERLDPAARVLYSSGTAMVTATITSARGDILAIPITNATSLTVTNGAGLNEVIPIPTMTRNRIPRTIVADLTLLEPNNTIRTSTVWNFALVCASANLQIGGAIVLYTPRTELILGDFQWGGSETRKAYGTEHENEYGTRYLLTRETMRRSVELTKLATQTDLDAIQAWFDGSDGKYGPSLLWLDPDVNDAYLGTFPEELKATRLAPTSVGTIFSVSIQFQELSKGRPV